jgi:hypothetical protein
MRTVIGLYPSRQDLNEQVQKIEDAGFRKDALEVISEEKSVKCLLGCEPNRIIAKYASLGALIGTGIYGVFFIVAAWCDCNLYPISQLVATEIVLAGVLAGAIFGGIIGVFIGLAEYEKDTHLYTQGMNFGKKLFVLQADDDDAERAMDTLNQIGCLGIRMLPY